MKKWMASILLIITIAGTFIPCCAFDECCADQPLNTSSSQHDDHEDEGTCSPFFACATCPGVIEVAKPFQLVVFIIEKNILYKTLTEPNLPVYATSFWQPPRSC